MKNIELTEDKNILKVYLSAFLVCLQIMNIIWLIARLLHWLLDCGKWSEEDHSKLFKLNHVEMDILDSNMDGIVKLL